MLRPSVLLLTALFGFGATVTLTGCTTKAPDETSSHDDDHDHDHADGDHDHDHGDHDHDHGEEVDLGSTMIGELTVTCAQSHGAVQAGVEGHLVVKLPYSDNGASVVRAWIGTEDRTTSMVGKGEYAASHDDYDIHAMAPDPLPANVMWWIEVEKPDGTTMVGSIAPKLD